MPRKLSKKTLEAVQRYGPSVDSIAQQYGISGSALLAKLVVGESGDNPKAVSGAGAKGRTQFMPGSRDIARQKYGVDPWHSADEAVHAAALHLRGKINGSTGLEGYNPGDPSYASYILNQPVGNLQPSTSGRPSASSVSGTRTVTTPGVDNSAQRRQLVQSFLARGGVRNQEAVLELAGQYGQAADIPGTSKTTRIKQPSIPSRGSGTGASGSKVLELIYNDGGKGYGIKDGQDVDAPSVYSGVWAGHANHVHVAAGPKTVVRLGKLAQDMGLSVGENPSFGGVDAGAHVQGSYHNKAEAIDVSGDPALMKAFAKRVKRYNRTRRL